MDKSVIDFLSAYSEDVRERAFMLREVVIAALPGITEQVDIPARMIAYCYGQKYAQLICTIIPSQKGLKLGFNRGRSLPDPHGLLEGTSKISRYIVISSKELITHEGIQQLLAVALKLYKELSDI